MARPKVILNGAGVRALLNDPGVTAELSSRMAGALAAAQASAPVESGAYRDSLYVWSERHATRTVVHLGARVPYGLAVEGAHGTLSRALDSAGG